MARKQKRRVTLLLSATLLSAFSAGAATVPAASTAAPLATPQEFPPIVTDTLDCASTETLTRAGRVAPLPIEVRSVSMAMLQQLLARCGRAGNCSAEVLHLGGLTNVAGLTLDRDDVVIWGTAPENGDPSAGIPTEDLVFALRVAWGQTDLISGNVRTIIPPVLSIDPYPATMAELRTLQPQVLKTARTNFNGAGDAWVRACARPQKVRLEGVPPGSHAAAVMLKADYDLKSIANGTIELAPWGVESMERYDQRQFRRDVCGAGSPGQAVIRMDRFWFHGGQLGYAADAESVRLDDVQVQLSTEAQMLSRSGDLTGQNRPSPEADRFVADFPQHMADLSQVLPVYRDLVALFRVIALAFATHDALGDAAASRLTLLLSDRQLLPSRAFTPDVPGRGRFTSTVINTDQATYRTFGASCGGVELWFPRSDRTRLPGHANDLAQTVRTIREGRQTDSLVSRPRRIWRCQ